MRVAVVGHVEWVEFLPVDGPVAPGAILHGGPRWSEPAGGGGVAAVELARLGGASTLYTALGDDPLGQRIPATLLPYGVRVEGPTVPGLHRSALTLLGPDGERTIVVQGEAQAPRGLAPLHGVDGVYVCKGDAASVRAARAARVVVTTARMLPTLREAGIPVDAVVYSAHDPSEAYDGSLDARLVVETRGAAGGAWWGDGRAGTWAAAPLPGPEADSYGCGDRFAAGLTWALAQGLGPDPACAAAARSGALARTVRGALGRPGPPA